MNLNEYQTNALKSVAIPDKSATALAHRALGLTGEAGIIANMIKKSIRDHEGILSAEDLLALKEKLGDTLYYIAVLAEFADFSLEEVAQANLQKSEAFRKSRKKK